STWKCGSRCAAAGPTTRPRSSAWATAKNERPAHPMSDRLPASAESAYVLHAQPYRETSLLVEAFTRPHGRIALVARGARRPRSALRGVLLAFHPLSLAWFGKGEVRTLSRAEWLGGQAFLRGEALLCGYYLNELQMRLLPREDAHEKLFGHYQAALAALARKEPPAPVLRAFEKALLAELGYALTLGATAGQGAGTGEGWNGDAAIDPAAPYCYDPERGPVRADQPRGRLLAAQIPVVCGQTLLD